MRMVKWGVGIFLVAFLGACGSSQRASQQKLALVNIVPEAKMALSMDTLKDTVLLPADTLKISAVTRIDSIDEPVVLTPEEKRLQERLSGINKTADWAPTIHYDNRKPNFVIIHHTAQNSVAQTVRTFQLPHTKVSAHYVIGKNGQVIQMLNEFDRAWHAGKSKWGTITDINSVSIGIELDNNGKEPFTEPQIEALLVLLDTLKTKYNIPQTNFIGHSDIAPTRKDDPSSFFPWKKLAERGFGIWYNEDFLPQPPANFNPTDALKIIGYDMTNPEAAIRAFKRRFVQTEVNSILTPRDIAILYDLYRKYY